ncbi:hypothetical protein ES705_22891 [subsurface metagenome]
MPMSIVEVLQFNVVEPSLAEPPPKYKRVAVMPLSLVSQTTLFIPGGAKSQKVPLTVTLLSSRLKVAPEAVGNNSKFNVP